MILKKSLANIFVDNIRKMKANSLCLAQVMHDTDQVLAIFFW